MSSSSHQSVKKQTPDCRLKTKAKMWPADYTPPPYTSCYDFHSDRRGLTMKCGSLHVRQSRYSLKLLRLAWLNAPVSLFAISFQLWKCYHDWVKKSVVCCLHFTPGPRSAVCSPHWVLSPQFTVYNPHSSFYTVCTHLHSTVKANKLQSYFERNNLKKFATWWV